MIICILSDGKYTPISLSLVNVTSKTRYYTLYYNSYLYQSSTHFGFTSASPRKTKFSSHQVVAVHIYVFIYYKVQ